jgi:hypothetical protein
MTELLPRLERTSLTDNYPSHSVASNNIDLISFQRRNDEQRNSTQLNLHHHASAEEGMIRLYGIIIIRMTDSFLFVLHEWRNIIVSVSSL